MEHLTLTLESYCARLGAKKIDHYSRFTTLNQYFPTRETRKPKRLLDALNLYRPCTPINSMILTFWKKINKISPKRNVIISYYLKDI